MAPSERGMVLSLRGGSGTNNVKYPPVDTRTLTQSVTNTYSHYHVYYVYSSVLFACLFLYTYHEYYKTSMLQVYSILTPGFSSAVSNMTLGLWHSASLVYWV